MSLFINNNVSSLQAQNALSQNTSALSTTLQQLSTGLQINSGADGPAAYVISTEQSAQIAGLQQASSNTSTAISLVQIAEGALGQINSLLTTARGLALSSANAGVNDQTALDANQSELQNILQSINNIATTTQFGSKHLLNGSAGIEVTQAPTGYTVTGTGSTTGGSYTLSNYTAAIKANAVAGTAFAGGVTSGDAGNLNINGVSIALNATNAGTLADALTTINGYSSQTGVTAVNDGGSLQLVSTSFGSSGNFTANFASSNLAADLGFASTTINTATATGGGVAATNAVGTLTDGNSISYAGIGNGNTLTFNSGGANGLSISFAAGGSTPATSTVGANGDVVSFTNNSLVFQTGANENQTDSVAINDAQTDSLGTNAPGVVNTNFTSLANIDINTTPSDAQDALAVIDQAISQVTSESASLGAFQANFLQSNANNLQTATTNTTAAQAGITDTDFAAATSNLAKYQVLTQAGAAALSSSNNTTQLVLSLLQKIS
jgi:flagellin